MKENTTAIAKITVLLNFGYIKRLNGHLKLKRAQEKDSTAKLMEKNQK